MNNKFEKVNSPFRDNIDAMEGYTPGEQPQRVGGWIKLNTNENPYPPSPAVGEELKNTDPSTLRLYPDPICSEIRRRQRHGQAPLPGGHIERSPPVCSVFLRGARIRPSRGSPAPAGTPRRS